jgi:hypothetical protein
MFSLHGLAFPPDAGNAAYQARIREVLANLS